MFNNEILSLADKVFFTLRFSVDQAHMLECVKMLKEAGYRIIRYPHFLHVFLAENIEVLRWKDDTLIGVGSITPKDFLRDAVSHLDFDSPIRVKWLRRIPNLRESVENAKAIIRKAMEEV